MKKHIANSHPLGLVALASVLALVASACGSPATAGVGAASAEDKVDGSSITMAMVQGLAPQFEQYVAAYQKQFPNRKVTMQTLPDDNTKFIQQLSTQALGGQLPDVLFNGDTSANRLAAANVTFDMSTWLTEGKDGLKGSNFLAQFLSAYRPLNQPEQVTALPVSADSVVLFYNKTLLKKYGQAAPTASWTWDDLYRAAAEVQRKSGGKIAGMVPPLGTGSPHPEVFNPVIHAYGGYVYDPKTKKSGIGQPAAIEAWSMLLDAYSKASPAYSANPSGQPKFEAGQVAFTFGVHASVPGNKASLKDDWDIATMPTIKGNPSAGGGSYGLSIGKTSKHKNAAWAFLAWFYDNNGGMKLAQATGQVVPPTADGLNNGTWKDLPAPPTNNQAFIDAAKTAVMAVQLPGKAQGVLDASVLHAIQQVVLEKRPVADAFADAEKAVNAALSSSK